MSLECVRKCRTAWCEVGKKHSRELFNLISNCEFESFSISIIDRLSSVPPSKKSVPAGEENKSQVLQTVKISHHLLWLLSMKSARHDSLLSHPPPHSPPSTSPTGQQRENRRDHCSIHALQQDICRVSLCTFCSCCAKSALVLMAFHIFPWENTSQMRGIFFI